MNAKPLALPAISDAIWRRKYRFAGSSSVPADQTLEDTFRRVAEAHGPLRLAILPIGAYEPRWFMKDQHVNPEEAVQIFQDLGCKQALAVHWGAFQLTDEALDEPPKALAMARERANLTAQDFAASAIGETWRLQSRTRS